MAAQRSTAQAQFEPIARDSRGARPGASLSRHPRAHVLALGGLLFLLLSAAMPQTAAEAAPMNLDFESGATGWSVNSGTRAAVVQAPVHGGVNALALSRASSSGNATLTDNPNMLTDVAPGAVCDVSAWVQGPAGHKATTKIRVMNGTQVGTSVSRSVSFNGTWQQLPLASVTMPSGFSSLDMQFFSPSFPTGQTWYIDDVSASCGASPPPPPPPPASGASDVATAAGLYDGTPFQTFGAYPYDYDNDGLQDVLINPHNEQGGLRLYKNKGNGTFTHVFAGQFVTRSPAGAIRNDRHGCDWGDVDRNGLPDLFCTMGADRGTLTDKSNELWMQQPGGGFVNKAADYGVNDPLGVGRTGEFLDVDNDGLLDLFVTNHFRSDGQPSTNRLFINQGGTSFRDASEYGLNVELGGMPGNQGCAHSLDFNKDGWTDLVVCGNAGLKLYRNDAGTAFSDVTTGSGIAGGQWRAAVLGDMNNDGSLDLVGINANATQFRVQLWNGTAFAPPTGVRATVAARQVGVGDVNVDGARDVYIVEGTTAPDVMLLGNGTGSSFSPVQTPQAPTGTGQSVTPFDHDRNGTTDMIVMHGYSDAGPIQLLSFPTP